MLRRGSVAFGAETTINLVFVVIAVLIGVMVGRGLYFVFFPPSDDFKNFATRIEYVVTTGSGSALPDQEVGTLTTSRYTKNTLVFSGAEDYAFIVFDNQTPQIHTDYDGEEHTYVRPAECEKSVCICKVSTEKDTVNMRYCKNIPRQDIRVVMRAEDTLATAIKQPAKISQETLYPTLGSGAQYSASFIPAKALGKKRANDEYVGIVYVEYTPAFKYDNKEIPPVLLVTPYTDALREELDTRSVKLDICLSGMKACLNKPVLSVANQQVCQRTVAGCEAKDALDCAQGPITIPCRCNGETREDGYCMLEPITLYFNNSVCAGVTDSCEQYCQGGLCSGDAPNNYACRVDFCKTGKICDIQVNPTQPDIGSCVEAENPLAQIEEAVFTVTSHGPGYFYVIANLPITNPLWGFSAQQETYVCLTDETQCVDVRNEPDAETLLQGRFAKFTPSQCGDEACLCVGDSEVVKKSATNDVTNTFSRCEKLGQYTLIGSFAQTAIHGTKDGFPSPNNVQPGVLLTPTPIQSTGSSSYGVATKRTRGYVLVEAYVAEEKDGVTPNPIVRITQITTNDRTVSLNMGCKPQTTCPPTFDQLNTANQ